MHQAVKICQQVLLGLLACQCLVMAPCRAVAETQVSGGPDGSARIERNFDGSWLFSKGDYPNADAPAFDDSSWQKINLPHDWSIHEPFDPHLASSTAYLPGGIGWYRKHFRVDESLRGKEVTVEFDGIYEHSEIWLNGFYVGGRPYGYSSFECDLTPYLKFGSGDNVLAVRVDHSRFDDSRWYAGSGIYRHVHLLVRNRLHIELWGTYVTTPEVGPNAATVQIQTTVTNGLGVAENDLLESEVVSPEGRVVGRSVVAGQQEAGASQCLVQRIVVPQPQRWTLDNPRLYTLRSRLLVDSNAVDGTTTTFGIRTLRFDADKGFFLNDEPLKIKGVCIHHAAGCLGAAVPEKVWERRLRILKGIGVNAIRTSHNPPAPELLNLCDRLGFLVMDEAFDEFTPGKNKWVSGRNDGTPGHMGYSEDFASWSVRDLQDMVRRDRNHPSIIMWSIGNEIDFANDPFSDPVLGKDYRPNHPSATNMVKLARPLIAVVKREDPTRPVTMALATLAMSEAVGLPERLDIVGYNYQEWRYPEDHAKYPKRFIFGSETSQRYDAWVAVRDHDYVGGQFLWTGIDYLGEAGRWPNHGSSAGLLNLCGFKKPLAWFRQSLWSDKPMVYLCVSPHPANGSWRGRRRPLESWNWRTNAPVTIHCYTTCSEVQLLLNDKVIGVKHRADAVNGVLNWNMPFEPGVLKAVGRNDRKQVCQFVLQTAGQPSRIELRPDTVRLSADGRDIAQVECRVVDAEGVLVPNAKNELSFAISGPARIIGLENGNLNSLERYGTKQRQVYHGRGLVILQSEPASGKITLTVTSPGLKTAVATLNSSN